MYGCVHDRLEKNRDNFVFIDEIQEIAGFEKALQSLFAEGTCDLYCTGSNAELLSGELATRLSGRHIQIRIFPLSYIEFLQFYKIENSFESCNLYLQRGGCLFIFSPLGQRFADEYLRNVSESILYRDVVG